jgi:hypothetical protein
VVSFTVTLIATAVTMLPAASLATALSEWTPVVAGGVPVT